ncbi:MAG: AI-2E family transporter [Acidimicrobiales bacterium]
MTEGVRRAGQVSWALVGMAAVLLVVGVVAWTVRVIFPPLILAAAIVFLLNPLVTALHRRGLPRAAGAGIAYLGVLGLFVAAASLIYPIAADQAEQLGDEWPEIREKAETWIDDAADASEGTFLEFTRQELEDAFSENDTSVRQQLDQARDIGLRVFHVLLILVLAPIIGFYLLVDAPHIRDVMESLVPERARPEVDHVAKRLNRAIGGFFRGQLVVALIVGVMCSIGLFAIGLKFWFLVGMIAGMFNLIPLIGPWVGGVPGLIIALTTGSTLQAIGVVAIMVAVQQVDNHFITPQVMQRAVQLHPAAVVLALLAGGSLGGFFGLLLAVPVAAVLKIVGAHLWRVHVLGESLPEAAGKEAEGEGPGIVQAVGGQAPAPPPSRPGEERGEVVGPRAAAGPAP